MARLHSHLLLRVLAVGLTVWVGSACHKGAATTAVSGTVGLVTDVGGRGDHSFNDAALRGLESWAAGDAKSIQETVPEALRSRVPPIVPLGVKLIVVQSKNAEDYEPNLQLLTDQGAGLVIATGFMLENALETVARRNPQTHFLLIDTPLLDPQGKAISLPNVRTVVFREQEGSYLAGALAAYASQTGQVGFIGGMDLPLIQRFETGFRAGALHGRPGHPAKVVVSYTGNFDNVASGKQVAQDLISRGVDVIYHAAGSDGLGIIQAVKEARENGKTVWAIGCDSDQSPLAPSAVLTSMVKHTDLAVYEAARDLTQSKLASGDVSWGLHEQGVALAPITLDFPGKAEALVRLKALEAEIASGKVTVPSRRAELEALPEPSRAVAP
jgi:basic membrane protein A